MQATIVSVMPALFAKRTVFNGGLPLPTAHFCNMRSSNGHTSCKGTPFKAHANSRYPTVTLSGPITVRHITVGSTCPDVCQAARGNVAYRDWSTHCHRGGNPQRIWTPFKAHTNPRYHF